MTYSVLKVPLNPNQLDTLYTYSRIFLDMQMKTADFMGWKTTTNEQCDGLFCNVHFMNLQ